MSNEIAFMEACRHNNLIRYICPECRNEFLEKLRSAKLMTEIKQAIAEWTGHIRTDITRIRGWEEQA